ncbi:MAG: hypothetical protein ACC642_07230, partial [Pseudomonadales bacterium]
MQDWANSSTELSAAPSESSNGDLRAPNPSLGNASLEDLQKELAKWQARVPKLAAALRERTNELEGVKAELRTKGDAPIGRHEQGSGIEARNALIDELEGKVKALSGKHQDAEGQLHARDLEITSLRQETAEWRDKWQSATAALDQQEDAENRNESELKHVRVEFDELIGLQENQNARLRDQELELSTLRESSQSLESRNEKLFETTALANRQIETLGDNLEHLRNQLKEKNTESALTDTRTTELTRDLEGLKAQISSRDQDIEFLHGHVEEKQTEIGSLTEQVAEFEGLREAVAVAEKASERLRLTVEEREGELASLADHVTEFDAL